MQEHNLFILICLKISVKKINNENCKRDICLKTCKWTPSLCTLLVSDALVTMVSSLKFNVTIILVT